MLIYSRYINLTNLFFFPITSKKSRGSLMWSYTLYLLPLPSPKDSEKNDIRSIFNDIKQKPGEIQSRYTLGNWRKRSKCSSQLKNINLRKRKIGLWCDFSP